MHDWCQPPTDPQARGQACRCPECGRAFVAFDYHAAYSGLAYMREALAAIPIGTLGWMRDSQHDLSQTA